MRKKQLLYINIDFLTVKIDFIYKYRLFILKNIDANTNNNSH